MFLLPCCPIRHKIASKCLQVFESIIAKLLLVISICSIIYSNNWLSVMINFSFLILALFSMITYGMCYKRNSPVLAIPMLVNQSVCIFWILIWLYASVTSITTGYLWSLEWLGGPKSSREPVNRDITHPDYVDPNETNPETKKSIKYGIAIMVASLVVLVFKVIGWKIAKTTFEELRVRKANILNSNVEQVEKQSDLGAESPYFPRVEKVPRPTRLPRTSDYDESEQDSFIRPTIKAFRSPDSSRMESAI